MFDCLINYMLLQTSMDLKLHSNRDVGYVELAIINSWIIEALSGRLGLLKKQRSQTNPPKTASASLFFFGFRSHSCVYSFGKPLEKSQQKP
jgi:hypothetical protein